MQTTRRFFLQTTCAAALVPKVVVAADETLPKSVPPHHEAMFWEPLPNDEVRCQLCPQMCRVSDGERGLCRVRENRSGKYYTLVHSKPSAIHVDPVEKKPLFHFRPGQKAFSLATAGCSLACRFCQNWELSQARPEDLRHTSLPPEAVVRRAQEAGAGIIAHTYSEPVVFYEYMRDICLAASGTGIGRVMISSGFIRKEPMEQLLPHLDAVKIDFKSFSHSFYVDVCSAQLRPVLDTLRRVHDSGVWLEIVVLVIPGLNDSAAEFEAMSMWIVQKLGRDVPVHFTRFHPAYRMMNLPNTPIATLERARKTAMEAGIRYAYCGNVPGHPGENTLCPGCGTEVIARRGFHIQRQNMANGRCRECGTVIAGVW
ncbi:MAG: AmmeMemoRadiSam system radical SAM enzyme [Myxococcales bacterium]|jgi:pyruvate formate lyase activating enzyme|nr:AmmeMemoRadiSam system radical SAM enzyme [Myxococcales bacterium]